jgi:O-antigen ligase
VTIDHPVSFARSKWAAFKHMPTSAQASSHLFTLGSNRYDFWRVAADEFAAHPLAGVGQHGFAAAYLVEGRSTETPQRSHSVILDQLSETGIVGLIFLVAGVGAPLLLVARRSRSSLVHAGIFGAGVYWLVHASGDWIWTFPAIGIPLFLMLGIGSSARSDRPIRARVGVPAAAVVAAIALFTFLPPWLSARFTDDALSASPARARDDLRWARRLDPLAVEPFVVQSALARTPSESIAALRRAVDLEPRSVANWYLLALEELKAGRRLQARRDLLIARSLYPRDPVIADALARTRMKSR